MDSLQGASNQFDHLLVVVKHVEPLLGIEGVAEHLDVALLQPILGVEELQPNLSVTGKQLVDAAVLLANGVEGRALKCRRAPPPGLDLLLLHHHHNLKLLLHLFDVFHTPPLVVKDSGKLIPAKCVKRAGAMSAIMPATLSTTMCNNMHACKPPCRRPCRPPCQPPCRPPCQSPCRRPCQPPGRSPCVTTCQTRTKKNEKGQVYQKSKGKCARI